MRCATGCCGLAMMSLLRASAFAPVGLVLLIFGACGHDPGYTAAERDRAQSERCLPQCGNQTFNPEESTCCKYLREAKLTKLLSQDVSACCGLQAYNPLNEMCCQSLAAESIITKTAAADSCQGNDVFDHLCCGRNDSKVQLKRKSPHHQCCGQIQFNTKTECCCGKNLQVTPLSECKEFCPSSNISATLYAGDGFGHLCCGRNGSKVQLTRKSLHHQCCGKHQFNPATESCNVSSGRFTPSGCVGNVADTETDTQHSKQQHKACLTNHCCGDEVYNASTHICCNGRSHKNKKNIRCCGTSTYDIKNPHMKCCMGSLHNLTSNVTSGSTDLCCGSRLRKKEETCCMSEDKQLLYSTKKGLQCCGHLYYNSSLWSCCSGKLTPRQQLQPRNKIQTNASRLLSVNNMKRQKLCKNITLGIVESVTQRSIVISNEMRINGKSGHIYPRPQDYVKIMPDDCSLPKLTAGKVYFFYGSNIYVNLDHKSVYDALYSILSMCQS